MFFFILGTIVRPSPPPYLLFPARRPPLFFLNPFLNIFACLCFGLGGGYFAPESPLLAFLWVRALGVAKRIENA